jgi:RNA polymerase-binding transcription factor DksA
MVEEFERRLRTARRDVWRTVVRTDQELATLQAHQAGPPIEDAASVMAAAVLSRLDGAQRHRLDEIAAAQARLATGTFGTCERCARAIPLARLRALPAVRVCVACERAAERARPA